MKAIHFGAGNIGRGFIGLLLAQSDYEVCFVDVNETLVTALQQQQQYTVELADGSGAHTLVHGVTAVNGRDIQLVAELIATADLVTTAVGVHILPAIAQSIAHGIKQRMAQNNIVPLPIIACENTIGGSSQLKNFVCEKLTLEGRTFVQQHVTFPDAAVDRIVPLQHHSDPLHVLVEPFYEWVVDSSALTPPFTSIKGVHYVAQLLPYIERKLFTVNTGHCCAAYYGYAAGYHTIQQAMADEQVVNKVRAVLAETGAMLVQQYGFDATEHQQYIDKIIERFSNVYLTDEIERVARSPIRKLSANDRLVRPARIAYERGLDTTNLVDAMVTALRYDCANDPEAQQIQHSLIENGLATTITTYTGLASDHPLHLALVERYSLL